MKNEFILWISKSKGSFENDVGIAILRPLTNKIDNLLLIN